MRLRKPSGVRFQEGRLLSLALFAALFFFAGMARANLLAGASFETPVVGAGAFQSFGTGTTVGVGGDWTVVGDFGQVTVVSNTFTSGGFTFPAQDGVQWLDLTGNASNSATGIQQSVPTTIGGIYELRFRVGNVVDGSGTLGTTSAVRVFINGVDKGAFTNSQGGGMSTQVWQSFATTFTADSGFATIRFVNADAATDNSNGLDNIELTRADAPSGGGAAALPWLLLLGISALRRRRSRP